MQKQENNADESAVSEKSNEAAAKNQSINRSDNQQQHQIRYAGRLRSTLSADFVEPDEPFADDEPQLEKEIFEELQSLEGKGNFLERDNFEAELGVPGGEYVGAADEDIVVSAPAKKDKNDNVDDDERQFADVAQHNIVDVVGDDRAGRVVIVLYAYRLPDNKTFDHGKFLKYLMFTLDKFVEQDYTIVYFHYGLRSYNKPPLKWLINAYKLLDRKYKKNLKALYLVHPTRFIRFAWTIFSTLISVKFERKLNYVNYLYELREQLRCDNFPIPVEIENHDSFLRSTNKVSVKSQSIFINKIPKLLPTKQFGVNLTFILKNSPGSKIPPIVVQIVEYLTAEGLHTEGLFRRSVALSEVKQLQEKIDNGDTVDFPKLNNPHLAAVLLKTFLRDLPEPLLTFKLFPEILKLQDIRNNDECVMAVKDLCNRLPVDNRNLLIYLVKFLNQVMEKSDANLMNATNLAIVFGPNLAWAGDEPVSLAQLQHVNNFAYKLLTNSIKLFD